MSVRAKFICTGVSDSPETQSKNVSFMPVVDGSEENKSFAKYTPAGSANLSISYETPAADFFEQDATYYLDFTKAE